MSSIQVDPATVSKDKDLFQHYLKTYYEAHKNTTGHIKYGTAGFRDHAVNLPHVCLRVGIFTGLVSKIDSKKVLGITITASHNPAQDNGIKQTDFDGGMIRQVLEDQVNHFVTEQDLSKAIDDLLQILNKIDGFNISNEGMVFIGRDTRESGPLLNDLMIQGIESVGSKAKDFGEVTTPMIHWLVRHFNLESHDFERSTPASEIVKAYHEFFINVFNKFFENLPQAYQKKEGENILLDCSNGIGGIHIQKFLENMKDKYNVITINTDPSKLNVNCGAEFLHKKQTYPTQAVDKLKQLDLAKTRCLGFDGDADRIVYYLPVEGFEKIKLLDGDKIISLYALMFQTLFRDIHTLYEQVKSEVQIMLNEDLTKWSIGMVQTPYANGSSTIYLRDTLKVLTRMSPNGVKNLHPRAHEYDIGIYCESNGHGTFTVKDERMETLKSLLNIADTLKSQYPDNQKVQQLAKLLNLAYYFPATQNQINGDAMTNFLCIEEALAYLGLSAEQWLNIYQDLHCLNSTVKIRDRSKMVVSENQDVILQPAELQEEINQIVKANPGIRSFVRPSGTEDIVRVYVEADSIEKVKDITEQVSKKVIANKVIN
ncbi:Alpha-D-phosphohexomutase, alpha/beta/alpha I/II/III [Pseudocohnilembus persalinus]|uniref:Phosphoacetylglucosamine mutase n=1 Tax=Pseudocohnilembus persalinus TaxID=266149 RepID=A0A0V0QC59_PSEPJ|nr:Alpha-D-phosphohexomutase, alpha/beta/alpha I/II/III [Pseudocohnilembus persalinus]|eukprot:KRW99776.1 Alpha-D-phosphohexomutase, alpha/beta/alpha I/II/III [Pseudocohnilembus persalinus]